MTDLSRYRADAKTIEAALDAEGYVLPHASLQQLSEPLHLVTGDLELPGLVMAEGTLVVAGSLLLTGPVDFQQSGRPIVNLVVTGDCTLVLAYVDAFVCVGRDLKAGTLIADSNWNGGVFVGGDLRAHTLVVKDIGVDVDGTQHVERIGDCDDPDSARLAVPGLYHGESDDADPRGFFMTLRDSFGKPTPVSTAVPELRSGRGARAKSAAKAKQAVAKKPAAKKPAAKKPAAKKPAAKKPAAKKPAARKPAAKKPAARKPAAKKPAARKPAARKPAARKPAARRPAARRPAATKPAAKKSAARKPAARRR